MTHEPIRILLLSLTLFVTACVAAPPPQVVSTLRPESVREAPAKAVLTRPASVEPTRAVSSTTGGRARLDTETGGSRVTSGGTSAPVTIDLTN